MAAYTTIDNPELYFQVKIYTGDGNDNRAITFDGEEDMQPDFLWFKNRGATAWHNLYDSVRGANKALASNATNAEESRSDTLDSFDSNGFTVGNDTSQDPDGLNTNASSNTYVCWAWKAGTSFSNDASATSVGDIDSSGSVNTDAGISLCSFTGNGSNSQTVKHGLSTAPELIILKARGQGTYGWITYDVINGAGKYLTLNNTDAATSDTGMWSNTAPTSSVFSLSNGGNTAITNPNTVTMMAYCFHSVKGYSKIGKYEGNGNADGAFIYTGFSPSFVMLKEIDQTGNWCMSDNKRPGYNPTDMVNANENGAETTDGTNTIDHLSNGFKLRTTGSSSNTNDSTYIYMAFAESPLVNSNGVPCNAK